MVRVVPLDVHTNNLVHSVLRQPKRPQRVLRVGCHCHRGKGTRRGLEDQCDSEIERGRRADPVLQPQLVVRYALGRDEPVNGAVERQRGRVPARTLSAASLANCKSERRFEHVPVVQRHEQALIPRIRIRPVLDLAHRMLGLSTLHPEALRRARARPDAFFDLVHLPLGVLELVVEGLHLGNLVDELLVCERYGEARVRVGLAQADEIKPRVEDLLR